MSNDDAGFNALFLFIFGCLIIIVFVCASLDRDLKYARNLTSKTIHQLGINKEITFEEWYLSFKNCTTQELEEAIVIANQQTGLVIEKN